MASINPVYTDRELRDIAGSKSPGFVSPISSTLDLMRMSAENPGGFLDTTDRAIRTGLGTTVASAIPAAGLIGGAKGAGRDNLRRRLISRLVRKNKLTNAIGSGASFLGAKAQPTVDYVNNLVPSNKATDAVRGLLSGGTNAVKATPRASRLLATKGLTSLNEVLRKGNPKTAAITALVAGLLGTAGSLRNSIDSEYYD